MPVPPFNEFIHPTLEVLAGGDVLSVHEAEDLVAWQFNLSPEEREIRTRGGTNTRLSDRTSWALTYLTQAGLTRRVRRSHYQITPVGEDALRSLGPGDRVDLKHLEQYEPFRDFLARKGTRGGGDGGQAKPAVESGPPPPPSDERTRSAAAARSALATEMAKALPLVPGSVLAGLTAKLLVAHGYAANVESVQESLVVQRNGEWAAEFWTDPFEFSRVCLRIHHTGQPADAATLHEVVLALQARGGRYGVIVSTGGFTEEAVRTAEFTDRRVAMLDANRLSRLLVESGIGVVDRDVVRSRELDPTVFRGGDNTVGQLPVPPNG